MNRRYRPSEARPQTGSPPAGALACRTLAPVPGTGSCQVPASGRLGASFRRSIDRRIEGAAAVGDHKPSMLQDVEAGRPLEVEALVGTVVELAELTGTPVPRIEAVYALTTLLDASIGGTTAGRYASPREPI